MTSGPLQRPDRRNRKPRYSNPTRPEGQMTTFCALDTAPPFLSPPLRAEAERVEFQFPDFHREDINLNETTYIARGVLC